MIAYESLTFRAQYQKKLTPCKCFRDEWTNTPKFEGPEKLPEERQ